MIIYIENYKSVSISKDPSTIGFKETTFVGKFTDTILINFQFYEYPIYTTSGLFTHRFHDSTICCALPVVYCFYI